MLRMIIERKRFSSKTQRLTENSLGLYCEYDLKTNIWDARASVLAATMAGVMYRFDPTKPHIHNTSL